METAAIDLLMAKDAIRELALLYCRGVDRKDAALLRTLYMADATDTHGDTFDGIAEDYVQFLERSFPHMPYSGHHVCNHLISVDGEDGEGEVYALAHHLVPDGAGGWAEDLRMVRYIDRYRRHEGKWYFASRVVTYDHIAGRLTPVAAVGDDGRHDISYRVLRSPLFARGPR